MSLFPSFKAGDKVKRLEDVFKPASRVMHGIVIEKYSKTSKILGHYPELYAVRWDTGRVQCGFLPHGLCRDE